MTLGEVQRRSVENRHHTCESSQSQSHADASHSTKFISDCQRREPSRRAVTGRPTPKDTFTQNFQSLFLSLTLFGHSDFALFCSGFSVPIDALLCIALYFICFDISG